ncbi:MAG TPA: glycosyl hydrolase family 18 protein [Chloroflexota bacterium]|nr:glycosyl hydrolase family 18 protein [Chloroflexota bacterium]HUM70856.1 glycosyl hydrolase family 18 protein [Chloroflexota bacterium]
MSIKIPFVVFIVLLLAACGTQAPPTAVPSTQTPMPTATAVPPTPTPFRIIGYVTDAVIVELLPFDKLTHINYAFAIPNQDGSLKPMANSWKIDNLVRQAHEHNVKVLISVGGWGHDETFEILATDPTARDRHVQELVALVEKHNLDGVDMDWEYPDPVSISPNSSQNYVKLMQALGVEMRARGKLLTAAVVALGEYGHGVDPVVFDEVDFLNLMVYDRGSEGHHSSLEFAQESLAFWRGRGLPLEKTVLGVPFYGRPNYATYKQLVAADPANAFTDEAEWHGRIEYYNGIPTIQQKTRLALEQASGLMIWTLEHDTQDETSLLQAIYQTVHNTP